MAEKLLGALAKGTYKAATDPVKSAAKQAFDPNIMRTVYRAGIIGPLIKSIVSEYKRGDDKKSKEAPVVKDVSRSLQSLNSQISSLTTIMSDIRELTQSQLQLQKDIFIKNQRDARKADLESVEEKIERPKASVSSLISTPGAEIPGKTVSFLGGIANFMKDNPLLSLLIGGTLVGVSGTIRNALGDFAEGADIGGRVSLGMETFKNYVGEGVEKVLDTLGLSIKKNMESLGVSVGEGVDKSVGQVISSGLISAGLARTIFRFLGLKGSTGFAIGAGVEIGRQLTGKSGTKQTVGPDGKVGESAESYFSADPLLHGIGGLLGGALTIGLGKTAVGKVGKLIKDRLGTKPAQLPATPAVQAPPVAATAVPPPGKLTPLQRAEGFKYGNISAQPTVSPAAVSTLSKFAKGAKMIGGGTVLGAGLSAAASLMEGDKWGALIGGGLTFLGGAAGSLIGPWGTALGALGGGLLGDYINRRRRASRVDGASVSSMQDESESESATGALTFGDLSEEEKKAFLLAQERMENVNRALNNPGGIMAVKDKKGRTVAAQPQRKFGATASSISTSHGRLLQFPSLEQGRAAQRDLWERNYSNIPLDQALDKWAGKPSQGYKQGIFSALSPSTRAAAIAKAEQRITPETAMPEKAPYEQIDLIRGLREIQRAATTIVDQSQTTNVSGGGSSETKRSQPSAITPVSRTMEEERSLFFGTNFAYLRPA